jgi:NAD(P)H-flavin reductase
MLIKNLANTLFRSKAVTIEGPYGCIRPLRQFDSIVLLAGSTGATFTFPLLRDIIQGWRENTRASPSKSALSIFRREIGAVTRHVRFVWVVKSRGQLGWFSEQLSSISTEVEKMQDNVRDVKLEITVYVTCDESLTKEHNTLLSSTISPNHEVAARKDTEHGTVQYRGRPTSTEEKNKTTEKEDVLELATTDSASAKGACRCRTTIDETTSPENTAPCCCTSPTTSQSIKRTSSTPSSSSKQNLLVHPSITIYSGRPKTRDIIRRSLEQALGESAVVVCGPQGLVADVKQDVCALSDERAVHKGTGAQGIYLHTESFSY